MTNNYNFRLSRPGARLWVLRGVLVAGRRLSGRASGRSAEEAVRHFAARSARELRADIATAIAVALHDPYKRVAQAQHLEGAQ